MSHQINELSNERSELVESVEVVLLLLVILLLSHKCVIVYGNDYFTCYTLSHHLDVIA